MSVKNITEDALVLVQLRNKFYKKKFYMMLSIFLVSMIVIGFLMSILSYLLNHAARPLYFVADDEGRLVQEVPLNVPFPTEEVIAWTIKAVEAANSFDFVNYRSQLQSAQQYFDDFSWAEYMKGLTISDNLKAVTTRKEVWVSKVLGGPKLVGTTISSRGQYAWKFEMPLRQTRLKPDNTTSVANYNLSVIVGRKPLLQSYKGLAILTMLILETGSYTAPRLVTPTS